MTIPPSETTLVHLFAERVRESGDLPALHVKLKGTFTTLTWSQIGDRVRKTAAGLQAIGIKPGDRVVQFAENHFQWIVCDIAIQMARAIHVPVHAPLAGQQVIDQALDCEASAIIVSDHAQANKLKCKIDRLPKSVRFVSFKPDVRKIGRRQVTPLSELRQLTDDKVQAAVQQTALEELGPNSLATILYTSGTTGTPKGVMLNHRNLVSNTLGTIAAFGEQPEDLRLNFLPLSHIFARTCDLYTWIARGSQLALAESRETILHDCARIKPTMLNGVPYFYMRVHRYLVEQNKADTPGALQKILGGEIRLCCSGGAALPNYLFDYFQEQGVLLVQGYGLSETSPVISLTTLDAIRRGSVGRPIPGVEVSIDANGEILTRGPHVMVGYYENQEATNEIIRNGWLHTGDLGHIDDDGFLYITGREKEIIVTAAGKNIAPSHLEELLCEDPLIIQAIVIGDGRNYLTALIVPDPDNLKAEMRRQRIFAFSKKGALNHRKVLAIYEQRIRERLACVSHHEQVRRFTLMDRGFTIETDEMTPKLSLKRKFIESNCADLIEAMYADNVRKAV